MSLELISRIEALPPERRRAFVEALKRDGARYDVHALTGAQLRMWLLSQLHPESPVYNVAYRFDITGGLDADALERALQTVRNRHEALRSVFLPLEGEPHQLVLPPTPDGLRLEIADLTGPDGGPASPERVDQLVEQEARRPFDLSRGPLLRAALFHTGHDEWVLALTLHHIVCDGWSMRLIYDDLARAYVAHRDGTAPSLPALPRYVEVARRQEDSLDPAARERLLAFWSDALSGAPRTLDLLTDRPRPAVLSDEGDQVSFSWPAELAEQLETTARRLHVTPFVLLLAACQALLYRYSGQVDILVGSPVAGRSAREAEDVVGLFVNTLVLRSRLSDDMTLAQLAEQARDGTFAALAHQELRFDQLVERLGAERALSTQPLVQVMVSVLDAEAERLELADLAVRAEEVNTRTAKFDLTFVLVPNDDRIDGRVEYRTQLFDRSTIVRLVRHLATLLSAALADPSRELADLPLLDGSERDAIRAGWGAFPPASRDRRPVTALIEDVADATPDTPAVGDGERTLTYAELDERANRIAALLRARGVRAETPVGVRLPRCSDLVAAFLGVLKAGGVYVPLDVQLPAERLHYLVRDAGVTLVLAHGETAASLPKDEVSVVELDADDSLAAFPALRLPVEVAPESAAYVIYTSGSTGRPKGVVGTHGALRNLADAQRELVSVRPDDRVLQFHSIGFDVSISELVSTLCAGAELRIAPRHALLPGADLAETIRANGITVADLPPVALSAMDPAQVSCLRSLTVGGEACPSDVAEAWAAGRAFHNAYGPTEATVTATAGKYEGGPVVPIGRPLQGVRAYVLDARLELVPVGIAGELYIGGAGLARGYLGDPVLTAERFLPDPFSEQPGQRMYRTGDVVRYLADGSLEFLGRADSQVKVRGHRIELGEVEARLRSCPGVRQGAVVVRQGSAGLTGLVAYVVGEALDVSSLRRELQRDLPGYMVPEAFVFVDDLPMTPSGKLDQRALPEPSDDRPELEMPYITPSGGMEERVASIWRDVLGISRIGVHDNFFDLGGNSLLLAKVRARLAEDLGVEVPALELFRQPTLARLARFLAAPSHEAPPRQSHERDVAAGRRAFAERGRRLRGERPKVGSR